jgi:hypothetical protein
MRNLEQMPTHWRDWAKELARTRSSGQREHLEAGDFNDKVRLRFPDGSFAFFEGAFCVVNEGAHEIAIFTEHCGYHIFPLEETEYSQLRQVARWERGQTG